RGIDVKLQKCARKTLDGLSYDDFITKFSSLATKTVQELAEDAAHGLFLRGVLRSNQNDNNSDSPPKHPLSEEQELKKRKVTVPGAKTSSQSPLAKSTEEPSASPAVNINEDAKDIQRDFSGQQDRASPAVNSSKSTDGTDKADIILDLTADIDVHDQGHPFFYVFQALYDIEGAYNGDGDFDSRRLFLLAEKELGSMSIKELCGGQINGRERMVLEIIRLVSLLTIMVNIRPYYMAPLCRLDPIPRPKDSEQKSQNVWERILEILFEGTRISVEIGETGLEPSKAERVINEAAYAATSISTPVTARKVDCKLAASVVKSKKWEFKPISNFELKPVQATHQQVEIQARKKHAPESLYS
ncbi:hypothetical protein BGX27_003116, partial [Mortierella sp. AM989]